jgi:hypothetical protein
MCGRAQGVLKRAVLETVCGHVATFLKQLYQQLMHAEQRPSCSVGEAARRSKTLAVSLCFASDG